MSLHDCDVKWVEVSRPVTLENQHICIELDWPRHTHRCACGANKEQNA